MVLYSHLTKNNIEAKLSKTGDVHVQFAGNFFVSSVLPRESSRVISIVSSDPLFVDRASRHSCDEKAI